jgi:hypothetical protein
MLYICSEGTVIDQHRRLVTWNVRSIQVPSENADSSFQFAKESFPWVGGSRRRVVLWDNDVNMLRSIKVAHHPVLLKVEQSCLCAASQNSTDMYRLYPQSMIGPTPLMSKIHVRSRGFRLSLFNIPLFRAALYCNLFCIISLLLYQHDLITNFVPVLLKLYSTVSYGTSSLLSFLPV